MVDVKKSVKTAEPLYNIKIRDSVLKQKKLFYHFAIP